MRDARMAGSSPNAKSGGERQRRREAEHADVHTCVRETRHHGRRQVREERHRDRTDGDAQRAAGEGEQPVLDHELSHEARAAGAERRAHREIALAARHPRQQQVRHVRAGDEQHEADRAHQDGERRSNAAGQLVLQRHERHRRRRILGWKLAAQLRLHGVDVCARGFERRPGPDPAEGLQMLAGATREVQRTVVTDKRPHVRALVEVLRDERLERRRHDADDGEGLIVHADDAADDSRVGAEPTLPEAVAQDDDSPAVRRIFLDSEIAPDNRSHAQRVKEVRRHA